MFYLEDTTAMRNLVIATLIFFIFWIGMMITDLSSNFLIEQRLELLEKSGHIFKGQDVLTKETDNFIVYGFMPIDATDVDGQDVKLHIPLAVSEKNLQKYADQIRIEAVNYNEDF